MSKAVHLFTLAGVALLLCTAQAQEPPKEIVRYGSEASPILSGVAIPEGRAQLWVSGMVPQTINPDAEGVERFGDMETQTAGVFDRIKAVLAEAGLGLEHVVYLRVYLVADPESGLVDYQSFFDTYGMYFNNEDNPVKTARSTIAVAGLVVPGWLVEIDALAIFPKSSP